MNVPFELMSDRDLNMLRGKALVGKVSKEEVLKILNHLTLIEQRLDETDPDDFFGTEGWRHTFGIPGAD